MQLAGASLDKSLFLFNPPLRNALLAVRQLSGPLSTMGMLSLPPRETFDIEDFIKAQSAGTHTTSHTISHYDFHCFPHYFTHFISHFLSHFSSHFLLHCLSHFVW